MNSAQKSPLEALAVSMMRRTHFPTSDMSPESLWNAQDWQTRDYWRQRANEVMNDIDLDGYKITEHGW
jgi:hypothetical protein